jgi:hypothetical protein
MFIYFLICSYVEKKKISFLLSTAELFGSALPKSQCAANRAARFLLKVLTLLPLLAKCLQHQYNGGLWPVAPYAKKFEHTEPISGFLKFLICLQHWCEMVS